MEAMAAGSLVEAVLAEAEAEEATREGSPAPQAWELPAVAPGGEPETAALESATEGRQVEGAAPGPRAAAAMGCSKRPEAEVVAAMPPATVVAG